MKKGREERKRRKEEKKGREERKRRKEEKKGREEKKEERRKLNKNIRSVFVLEQSGAGRLSSSVLVRSIN
jgi:hypothetical protein